MAINTIVLKYIFLELMGSDSLLLAYMPRVGEAGYPPGDFFKNRII